MSTVVHLNNAGAALPPRVVVDTVVEHLRAEELRGGYEVQTAAADRIEGTYHSIASLIGARADEIALVENATRGWDMAFYGFRFDAGQRLLTSRSEYASNSLAFQQVAARSGVVVEAVDDDGTGVLDVADLRRRLAAGDVALVAITHVPTHNGLVNPAAEIGAACRAAGVPFLLDACQSVGQLPVDVREIGCDLLAATGRKWLRGPRGTGFLYVSRDFDLEPPFVDLRAVEWPTPAGYRIRPDARRFEGWESAIGGRLGLGAAVDYALGVGIAAIAARVQALAGQLRTGLAELPGVRVLDVGKAQCGIVTFRVDGVDPEDVVRSAAAGGVTINVGSAATATYDRANVVLQPVARASPHYYNTEDELLALLAALPPARSR